MAAPGEEPAFKEISIVPDYRALQIITESSVELKSFLENGGENGSSSSSILKSIYYGHEHKKFLKQLGNVQQYLAKKCSAVPTLNSDTAALIATELKSPPYGLSKEEIVMILNQLPLTDQRLEMMFPGKFSKEQVRAVIALLNGYLDIQPHSEGEDEEEEGENGSKMETSSSGEHHFQPVEFSADHTTDVHVKEELWGDFLVMENIDNQHLSFIISYWT